MTTSATSGTLRGLVLEFFKAHGAQVKRLTAGRVAVSLESREETGEEDKASLKTLSELFARPELHLAFDAKRLEEGDELVVEGGHVMRLIEQFIGKSGARVYVEQPAQARLTQAALRASLSLVEGLEIGELERIEEQGYEVFVVYKVHFRGRTRRDSMVSVRALWMGGELREVGLAEPPKEATEWPWKPRKKAPAEILGSLMQSANRVVEAKVSEDALSFREEGRAQIQKDILRIKSFYSGQVQELMTNRTLTDAAREKIVDLEEEQARKIKEQLRAIAVQVEIEAAQLMVIERPLQRVKIPFQRGERRAESEMIFDRVSGELERPEGFPTQAVDLCDGQHLCSRSELRSCLCELEHCPRCIAPLCYDCARPTCAACGASCGRCGERGCAEHRGRCEQCEDERCLACQAHCAGCERKGCKACMPEAVSDSALCRDCAGSCAGCGLRHRLMSLKRCQSCGRRYGGECLAGETCRACENRVSESAVVS